MIMLLNGIRNKIQEISCKGGVRHQAEGVPNYTDQILHVVCIS